MGRAPCCDKANVKRGPWSPEEDTTLKTYVQRYGTGGNWIALPHKAGLKRCGKSCRLRWLNYLRPDIKHGGFTEEEDNTICTLYNSIGSRWSVIASQLPGRTDNDIKNYWNTKLKKKLFTGKTSLKNNNNITSNTNIHHSATPAASLTKAETTHNYGFSASLTTSSPTFPSSMEASYGQIVDPQRLVADPNHFPLSGCTEMLEFARSANNYSGSSSQEVSSLSGSSSAVVDNNYVSNWSGNVGGDQDGFLMDFSFGHPYDLLNGFGFHERTSEVAPNFSPNLANSPYTNLLANCSDTKPQGIHQSITN